MNSLGEPTCLDELPCVIATPALRALLAAGDYWPDRLHYAGRFRQDRPQLVARQQIDGGRAANVFHVQRCWSEHEPERWVAYAEYCPFGRTPSDSCYAFLVGERGSFATRAAAERVIFFHLAALHDAAPATGDSPYGV
jgi:hypothetical protein